jgi:hypothetical protein
MSKKGGLLSFDAFAKTVEDARIKTRSGGFITLGCILTLLVLITNEWSEFNKISIRPELVVDRESNAKLDINLDVVFPDLPCDQMSMDIMDVSGELQVDIQNYGFAKIRLDPDGNEIEKSEMKIGDDEEQSNVPDDYCGPCYGAKDQSGNEDKPQNEKVCCNDCQSVRKAYAAIGWAFYDGKDVEQCEREGYVKMIRERMGEGCRVTGTAKLNRINGNLHFAPGASFSAPQRHVHDVSLYSQDGDFSFKHKINHFSFGPSVNSLYAASVDVSSNPLDGVQATEGGKEYLYSYYLKVVPTRFEYLDGKILETYQFSSTYHDRPLSGGRDDDHPNTLHARGGIPGLFFNFEMSALKVINREDYQTTWPGFLLNVISAIGGVLTVGAVLDRTVYAANKALRTKKDK